MSYSTGKKVIADKCIKWIQEYAKESNMKKVVIGISGGKDSTVAAALCCNALGKENVYGVLMPNGGQNDIDDSHTVCNTLGIKHMVINIKDMYTEIVSAVDNEFFEEEIDTVGNGIKVTKVELNKESKINVQPRIRMIVLYAIAQSIGARVCGTSNLSEKTVGYCTKWGDTACDFNPLGGLTTDEVVQMGDELGLPEYLVHKEPSDGLTGLTDENSIGISYKDINAYINGDELDNTTYNKIRQKEVYGAHKMVYVPTFKIRQ